MKNKIIISIILLFVINVFINKDVYASPYTHSGTTENGQTWTVDTDVSIQKLTITGSGDLPDYSSANPAPWIIYLSYIEHVEIDEGITRVGNHNFDGLIHLHEVKLPSSLRTIGDKAFYACEGLMDINFPSGLMEID